MFAHALQLDRDDSPREDHVVILHDVTWEAFEMLLEQRGERGSPRFHYDDGELEIMSPSRTHEGIKSVMGCLVEAWCLDRGIEFGVYGSWTLKDKPRRKAAEPDECYIFGTDQRPERPHLAIEVVWTSGGLDKRDIYAALGVQELWTWQRGRISVSVLRDGAYVPATGSTVLPGIPLDTMAQHLGHDSTSAAIRAWREATRSPQP